MKLIAIRIFEMLAISFYLLKSRCDLLQMSITALQPQEQILNIKTKKKYEYNAMQWMDSETMHEAYYSAFTWECEFCFLWWHIDD